MRKGTILAGSTTDRVLDRLTTDGGWMATTLIHDHFPEVLANTVDQALMRLRSMGWVESRRLAEGWRQEHEWRVHPDFEWDA